MFLIRVLVLFLTAALRVAGFRGFLAFILEGDLAFLGFNGEYVG
jgi:hypothetical protein